MPALSQTLANRQQRLQNSTETPRARSRHYRGRRRVYLTDHPLIIMIISSIVAKQHHGELSSSFVENHHSPVLVFGSLVAIVVPNIIELEALESVFYCVCKNWIWSGRMICSNATINSYTKREPERGCVRERIGEMKPARERECKS